jgi:hypothetical protein
MPLRLIMTQDRESVAQRTFALGTRRRSVQIYGPAGVSSGIAFLVPPGQGLVESEPDWTQWQRENSCSYGYRTVVIQLHSQSIF